VDGEYDGPFAKACDQEKGIKDHVFLYTMPNKPSVELCAQARDNAYNYTEESCVTYYTGDHWEGTIDGTGERNDPSMEHAQVEYHATLQFTVDKYGYILGDGVSTFSNAVGETCTNPNSNKPEHPFTVSGTATANHLEIKLQTSAHDTICSPYLFTIGNNKTVTVPITGPGIAEGEGVISDGAPYISGTYTIRLTCKNCQ